jgi:hypothetical protein
MKCVVANGGIVPLFYSMHPVAAVSRSRGIGSLGVFMSGPGE